jgi:hypothetical protein
MNSDQLTGVLRAFIPGITALLAVYNIGSESQNAVLATLAVSCIVGLWSMHTNKPGTVIAPTSPAVVITKETPAAIVTITSEGTSVEKK